MISLIFLQCFSFKYALLSILTEYSKLCFKSLEACQSTYHDHGAVAARPRSLALPLPSGTAGQGRVGYVRFECFAQIEHDLKQLVSTLNVDKI